MPAGIFFCMYGNELLDVLNMCLILCNSWVLSNTLIQASLYYLLSCAVWMGVFFVGKSGNFSCCLLRFCCLFAARLEGRKKFIFFARCLAGGGKYAIIMDSTKCFKFAKAGKELCGWRIRRM